jgi:rhodanese-related sulfurtransferase
MSSFTSISPDKLARLIGMAKTPVLIDVRTDKDFAADPRRLPGRRHEDAADWGDQFSGRSAIVVCQRGQKLSDGTSAWLRHVNVAAEALEEVLKAGRPPSCRWYPPRSCRPATRRGARSG